ncbi:MAG: TlpA family protein disulfide reductase [Candidatus Nitricoxidivorans perseverans]|uniref:TlpA family protein disulfide reductase n=1 Tax=Candidatus Nitricoxidivorans perseverans TaxID=2975601 RepID=A0AA49FJX0_9PROT|nr:MAG: TlpA family protein disulfide reductase [Candidatus Nitricoxidivorans perseverans]
MRRGLIALALCLAATAQASAAELRPFTTGSVTAIKEQFAGRPFILVLWSTTCTHCAGELKMLGRLVRKAPALPLALVSTDTPEDGKDIRAALGRFGLGRIDTWVFDDDVPERLRFAIDPSWRGELPRSYLFDAAHRREAHAGSLGEATVKQFFQSRGKPR